MSWVSIVLAVLRWAPFIGRHIDRWIAKKEGRKDATLDAHEKQVENVTKAKRAAARVRTDGELRGRVRKRYTAD